MASWTKREGLNRGQILVNMTELSEQMNMSKPTLRKAIKFLEEREDITVKRGQHQTLITIIKWDRWQIRK